MTDHQGQNYKSCIISSNDHQASREWMVENLNVNEYCNGDRIIESKSMMEWSELNNKRIGGWCYYDNKVSYGEKYGKLYNWYAINDLRGIAPEGWKVPSDEDWKTLEYNLGMDKDIINNKGYRGKVGNLLKSKTGWNVEHKDEFGFNALPGGGRYHNGAFEYINIGIGWWSSTQNSKIDAWRRNIFSLNSKINRNIANNGNGFYIRCIKEL